MLKTKTKLRVARTAWRAARTAHHAEQTVVDHAEAAADGVKERATSFAGRARRLTGKPRDAVHRYRHELTLRAPDPSLPAKRSGNGRPAAVEGVARSKSGAARGEEPDVFLEVPDLKIDELHLELEDLRAHVSLEAQVLDLLKLNVGADAQLGRTELTIKGVEAQATLKVHLDNVAGIVNRVMTTIERNPQIVQQLLGDVGSTLRSVGSGAGEAVGELGRGAGEGVGALGHAAQSMADGNGSSHDGNGLSPAPGA
jgi:hypothetical protein